MCSRHYYQRFIGHPNTKEKVFHPCLVKQGVNFTVLLFVDDHVSHKSNEVTDVCQSLGIILLAYYPNTTHITQPADVAVFKPLKDAWRSLLKQWRFQNLSQNFTFNNFGQMRKKAMETGIKTNSIKNGFRACELYPFDPDHVDFTKYLNKIPPSSTYTDSETSNSKYSSTCRKFHSRQTSPLQNF